MRKDLEKFLRICKFWDLQSWIVKAFCRCCMFLFQSPPPTLCSNSWREWFYRFNGLSADRCQHDKADASTVDHAPATPHGQIQIQIQIQMGKIQIWIEMQIKMDTSMYCTVQSILLILSYLATFRHVWLWGMGSTCECTLQLDIVYSPGHCLMRPRILQMLYQCQIIRRSRFCFQLLQMRLCWPFALKGG